LRQFVESDSNQQRGECVVLVAGWTAPESLRTRSAAKRCAYPQPVARRNAAQACGGALAAQITGERKNVLYQVALDKQKGE
jgi:16S rRNA (cytidine1402-2'-O)-methyltransferase